MYYSEEYIIKKIKQKLPDIKINKIHKNNKEIYQLDYKNHKGEIDLETFKNKFTTNKTKESDNSLENYLNIITKNFLLQENFKIENIPKEQFLKKIYPVMRAKTFLKDKADNFLTKEHTHESKIFYALDLKDSYKLIEKKSLAELNLQEEVVKKEAIENLKKLPLKYNKEEIKGNTFYFLNAKDGYDGSRILDEEILKYFFKKIQKKVPDGVRLILPGVDGLNAAEHLRSLFPECGIIWGSDLNISLHAFRLRVEYFFMEPVEVQKIQEGLAAWFKSKTYSKQ